MSQHLWHMRRQHKNAAFQLGVLVAHQRCPPHRAASKAQESEKLAPHQQPNDVSRTF